MLSQPVSFEVTPTPWGWRLRLPAWEGAVIIAFDEDGVVVEITDAEGKRLIGTAASREEIRSGVLEEG
jgi:hypothetical protein